MAARHSCAGLMKRSETMDRVPGTGAWSRLPWMTWNRLSGCSHNKLLPAADSRKKGWIFFCFLNSFFCFRSLGWTTGSSSKLVRFEKTIHDCLTASWQTVLWWSETTIQCLTVLLYNYEGGIEKVVSVSSLDLREHLRRAITAAPVDLTTKLFNPPVSRVFKQPSLVPYVLPFKNIERGSFPEHIDNTTQAFIFSFWFFFFWKNKLHMPM